MAEIQRQRLDPVHENSNPLTHIENIPLAMFVVIFLFLFRYNYEEKLPAIIDDNKRIEAELQTKKN